MLSCTTVVLLRNHHPRPFVIKNTFASLIHSYNYRLLYFHLYFNNYEVCLKVLPGLAASVRKVNFWALKSISSINSNCNFCFMYSIKDAHYLGGFPSRYPTSHWAIKVIMKKLKVAEKIRKSTY